MLRKFHSFLSAWMSALLVFGALLALIGQPGTGRAEGSRSMSSAKKEDTVIFESATNFVTNLSGWRVEGQGKMENTEQGALLSAKPDHEVMAIAATKADDFVLEADVMITDREAEPSLIFRSDAEGRSFYKLTLIPKTEALRLSEIGERGAERQWGERRVPLAQGGIYHLKVKAEGSRIQVYWGDSYAPALEAADADTTSGSMGLHVRGGAALFQNVKISEFKSNLGSPVRETGNWQPDLKGLRGAGKRDGTGSYRALRIYREQGDDLVLEGNFSFGPQGTERSDGGLLFRTNANGTEGYEAALVKEKDEVRVQLRKMDGTVIQTSARAYPSPPTAKHHLEITAVGPRVEVHLDGYAEPAVKVTDHSFSRGHAGLSVSDGTGYFQDVYLTAAADYYTEKYRPDYHYSPARGSASDPNGLVYFEGEYHLFHQDGGTWAHAVSTDLVHWKRLPVALPWNEYGHVWSGSAVADLRNASGLFDDAGGKGLIAYYTSYNPDAPNGNQRIGLAYSKDAGRTWAYSKERPIVIENPGKQGEEPGGWDFRDPKVVRDEANNRWVMVVSGGDHIRFFTSPNLLDWTLTDLFGYGEYVRGGVWECPDLFPLKVEGTDEVKWVLMISTGANPKTQGSAAEYFIGELTPDGKFVNDHPAGKVLTTDYGKEYYASMSFSDLPDSRRIMLAWMTNWDYPFAFPTQGWKGTLSIPRELTLRQTEEGPRLFQAPIRELASLERELFSVKDRLVTPKEANLLQGLSSGAYELEALIEIPEGGTVKEFGFRLREGAEQKTVAGYKVAEKQMFVDRSKSGNTDFSPLFSTFHTAPLIPENGKIKLKIFVDDASVEVFGNDGRAVISDVIFPDPASREMGFYTDGGKVRVVSLKVNALNNVWNPSDASTPKVVMDTDDREISVGDALTLNAAVAGTKNRGNSPIRWTTSDAGVAEVESSGKGRAVIRGKGKGEAILTASTADGRASAGVRVKVFAEEFHTNLTGWTSGVSGAAWVATEQGIRGRYDGDAAYMAREKAGDFTLEAEMKLAQTGGAGSVLFRASPDGRSGYFFNIDPNMKAFRLFYKLDGAFAERQVLAKVPAFLQPGKTYRIRIEASGPRIRVFVDGRKMMEVADGTFAEGHLGVHVFGGEAYFQHVNAGHMEPAKLQRAMFVHSGGTKTLFVEKPQNGEPVILADLARDDGSRVWVLVPTGDEAGSYSIRTEEGKALDLDTGQNKLQLYDYLGYPNQRWLISKHEDGTVSLISAHHHQAIEVTEDGSGLSVKTADPSRSRQRWKLQEP